MPKKHFPHAVRQLLMILSYDELKTFAEKRGKPLFEETMTGQLYLRDQETTTLFRIYEGNSRLQIMTYFNTPIPKHRFEVFYPWLNRLNHQVDFPGFGLDEANGLTFHRAMILSPSEKQLSTYFDAIPPLCDYALPAIKLAATSLYSYNDLLTRMGR